MFKPKGIMFIFLVVALALISGPACFRGASPSLQESAARIQVTRGLGFIWGTRLSPDGQQIAFTIDSSGTYASGATAIFVAPISGGKPIQLTTWADQSLMPSWSPDGSQLAFISYRTGSSDIWIMTASGTDQRRITSDTLVEENPAWSPDGQWIAFCSNKGGRWNLWIVPAAGGEPKQVTHGTPGADGTAGDAWAPAWSPDSRHLLFLANWGAEKGHWHMWRAPLEGGKPIQLTYGTDKQDQPAWSPDGRWIAFISKRGGKYDLWLMPAKSGGRPQQLTDDEESEDFPTWSPDGKWLVYDFGPWPSGIRDVWMLNVEWALKAHKRRH